MWGTRDVNAGVVTRSLPSVGPCPRGLVNTFSVGHPLAKKTSTENRKSLHILVAAFGNSIMPCSNCVRRKMEDSCVLDPAKSNRCDPCVKSGVSCDGHGLSVAAARKIVDEKRRLEREEEAAEDELINLQAESTRIHNAMNAQFAKITRLRRQRRQVEVRGMDMIQRGLSSMDELEKAEQNEQAALENAMADGTFRDWSAVAEQSEWDSLGLDAFIDRTSGSGVGGSSSGVVGHS
ncbi:hypothetical protein HZS61_009006 [Fusarium oxysporum f. sp. conglutinans]|uniref:Uncharacterized protein n=1 Tax=Fusarium oxysporum f. sp. conglutinans TaxID=100902 RepID=A0A8H6LM42_FUSOX|nr:hypothetical protein HZS61_009006 [Fusarium oxysporum f. sp. conglutinans]KAG6981799.1 hypothetical protein FocnCong_v009276 [Fusarium oxysporum f. sp. conglutinans]KAG6998299.1 hypothetical protein FocnCong_v013537 [Fusarium oxysporum f. sp. conglutinans]KAG6999749.1 hypothetical protein FocnCong_v012790 [Fusarium oxysporum f. sp. conglutinans]KAG7001736.1 hypothetical protein FocnCong_v011249 [Fusarium oxysporum f. sp. conglutinans]